MTIRRQRLREGAASFSSRKRQRRAGPVLMMAGIALVMVDTGNVLEYPLPFFVGTAIIILLFTIYRVSST